MSDAAKFNAVILWGDELRAAAKAMHAYQAASSDASTSDAEMEAAIATLVNTCWTALNGAWDDDCALLLATKPAPSQE